MESTGSSKAAASQGPARRVRATTKVLPGVPGDERVAREQAARDLAINYLNLWSARNRVTLGTAQAFYGPRVLFHGHVMSSRALLEEKRRFIQRWPLRSYHHRPGTIDVECEFIREACIVRSVFDFTAVSPQRGRRSHGSGALELVVSFAGERPVIAAEHSMVLTRSRRV